MKTRLALSLGFALCLAPFVVRADNEIGFVEKFALAPDREAVLDQLLPGSEDYYFYHALHDQNTRQAAKLTAILEQWAKRFPNSDRRRIIENRAALLAYDANPQATLKFLRERLNLEFNHEQQARDQKPDLPTKLDPALVSRAAFQRAALENSDDLSAVNDEALATLLREKVALSPSQTRDLLKRLKRPDVPGLVDLIAADLKTKESRGFGEFEIHRALLPEQMDELARRLPTLFENQKFIYTRLHKLAPSADADAEFDPAEREAWLDRLWAYAKNLSGSFNSLKAQLLLQRLEHDRTRGTYDKARFQEYLKLPRRTAYANLDFLRRANATAQVADLNTDVSEALGTLRPMRSDEELVRDYLLHLLKDEPTWEPWAVWLRDTWLKPVFAEAKIVNGIGDPEKWASLLPPSAFQALKERVDVDFSPANPPFLTPTDDVSLDLLLKNTPKLIVKIYEINTLSFFLTNQRQLNTDLALDGLVANREVTHDFSADEAGRSPFRRTARTFKFPELKGQRGAWIIEFIGGGKSSRALVRKGQWSLLQRTGPAGDMLTVLDEARQPVRDAVAWLDGRKFTPDEKSGYILVPFTQQAGRKPIVLADAAGGFATLASFEHHAEEYKLDAQIHVEREQLLAGREATVAVRAALLLGDAQVSPGLLKNVKLTITSTTLDEVETTSEVPIEKLDPAKVFTHVIKVPERLAQLDVRLQAQVESMSAGGKLEDLFSGQQYYLNGIDKTTSTAAGHLSKFEGAYLYELLGRNGEPLPDRPVEFVFTHRDFNKPLTIDLRTDEKGRVECGMLAGVADMAATASTEGDEQPAKSHWPLALADRTWPGSMHAVAGEIIQVPWNGAAAPEHVSLLERRGDTFVADRSAAVNLTGDGGPVAPGKPAKREINFLTLKGLEPGDYLLTLPGEREITIRVTAGQPVLNWLVSPSRELEVREAAPLNIVRVEREAGALVVQLANASAAARVHLAATRFLPEASLLEGLGGFTRFEPAQAVPARSPNLFAAGRAIGDEYRYILERRYAKLFPGNMLPRPGLLLNPWETRATDLQAQSMEWMEQAHAMPGGRAASTRQAEPTPGEAKSVMQAAGEETSDLEFLAQAAPVLYNLVPDEKGVVRIDLKALSDRQYVQIYAEDLTSAVWRTLALPEVPTKFQDLRLVRNLDPQKPFAEKKEATVLDKGQTLTLADILTADLETYDSLAGVYALFTTLNNDPKLAKFAWAMHWPTLKEEEKRAKYSEFACHELNFFLARKDPAFFQKVVQPYLRNKRDRTFMDDYLLGNDLRSYLEPWAFARLNAAERCLLAQRVPGEGPATARHERELWELLTPNPERENQLFETALRGRALSAGEADAFKAEKSKLKESANAIDALIFPASPAAEPKVQAAAGGAAMPSSAITWDGAAPPAPPSALAMIPAAKPMAPMGDLKSTDEMVEMTISGNTRTKDKVLRRDVLNSPVLDTAVAQRLRAQVRPFFRALGPAKEWAENDYYQLPLSQQDATLIPVNTFWRDYAAWDGKTPFVSAHFAEAARNFPEMMLALAVLDLPFESPKHTTKSENGQYSLTAAGPLIAFHKEIKPAAPAPEQAPLLVSQNFFRADDRYREEGNEKFDKYVTDEFLAGVVYGANVVVTNPTSTRQTVSVLLQIPRGALPVNASKATDSRRLALEPYSTQTQEYYFYFPAPAAKPLPHYPVHVARDEQIVGEAKPFTFKVVRQLSEVDKTSWDYVSQYGSEAETLAFLDKANIERLDLEDVAWRARKSAEFFRKLVALLEKRHVYSEPIYRYAVLHNAAAPLATWLRQRGDFINQCGPYLDAKLLKIDPIERRAYEHLEYSPLVNQRAHRVGAENRTPNPVLRGQYQRLLDILAHKGSLDAADQMSVVYYLFLQDRIEEALARFHAIAPEALPTRLQHDYFRCYAAFYEEQPAVARGLAQQYADYPVDRWRQLFAEVAAQLDEIEGRQPARPGDPQPNREKQQEGLAATEPSFDFKVENRQIALTWKNLPAVTINYYLMDPEFLFSASPFVAQDAGRFSIIKPTRSDTQSLAAGQDHLAIPLPAEFAEANVLVEILGAGQRKAQTYHANTLKLTLAENYGRLEARDEVENKPVSRAYVKVYARLHNGTVRFFKDGYTDLRGRFDYASLNSSESPAQPIPFARNGSTPGEGMNYQMLAPAELNQVERLAVLLLSESHGADVREAAPPQQ